MPPASPTQEKLPGWAPAHLPQTFHGVSSPYYPFEEYFNTFPSGLNYLSKEGKMCCILIPWALHLLDSEGSLWWWYQYAWEVFIRHIESFRVGEGYDWNSEDRTILYWSSGMFASLTASMKWNSSCDAARIPLLLLAQNEKVCGLGWVLFLCLP